MNKTEIERLAIVETLVASAKDEREDIRKAISTLDAKFDKFIEAANKNYASKSSLNRVISVGIAFISGLLGILTALLVKIIPLGVLK